MKKKLNQNSIDRIVSIYFNELEEELGFNLFYKDLSDEEIKKRMKMNFKYFKAGFLMSHMLVK